MSLFLLQVYLVQLSLFLLPLSVLEVGLFVTNIPTPGLFGSVESLFLLPLSVLEAGLFVTIPISGLLGSA